MRADRICVLQGCMEGYDREGLHRPERNQSLDGGSESCLRFSVLQKQTVKKVPTGRHARTVGTHTGKFGAESVRAALRRVRGSALNFVPRDCEAEARPADETAEAEQGQRSAFCKPAATGAAKAGNRNHQGEGISVPRMRAEMGSPWSVSFFDTLSRSTHRAAFLDDGCIAFLERRRRAKGRRISRGLSSGGASGQTWGRCGPRSRCGRCRAVRSLPYPRR